MRFLFALVCLGALAFYAADAFGAADSAARSASVTVVADRNAYLAISSYATGANSAFVTEDATTGVVAINFGSASGVTGIGINPGAGYYFHDTLKITNQGNATVYVQTTAGGSPGSILSCAANAPGAMTRTCYAAKSPASALALAVGENAYVGLHANATSVTAGSAIVGTLRVHACRTAATTCSTG